MRTKKLEDYFINANEEYSKIEKDVRKHLNQSVSEEVITFVDALTDEAINRIWDRLSTRYEALNKLDETFPEKPKEEDRTRYLSEYFRLTNPRDVSKDFIDALNLNFMEEEYRKRLERLSDGEYGEIFNRYMYTSSFFNGLTVSILQSIKDLTNALNSFARELVRHSKRMETIRQKGKEKAWIKGGASLLGLMIGIPFAGAGVGALMGSDKDSVNQSLNQVFNGWGSYVNRFQAFFGSLEENIRLAMVTLYGGTVLRANEQLSGLHFELEWLSIEKGLYDLTLTEEEREETSAWMNETTSGIQALLDKKNWMGAITASKELLTIISRRPVTARTILLDGRSALYAAHLSYFDSYKEALLTEYRNGHIDQFYYTTQALFKELPLLIQDADLQGSSQAQLIWRYAKEAVRKGNTKDLTIVLEYLTRVFNRIESEGYYEGEVPESGEERSKTLGPYTILDRFVKKSLGPGSSPLGRESLPLSRSALKELKKIDAEVGSKDELSRFLTKLWFWSLFSSGETKALIWMKSYWKKFLTTASVAGIICSGLVFHDELYHSGKNLIARFSPAQDQQQTVTESPIKLKITTEYANVRSNPSLEGSIIANVNGEDRLTLLDERKKDDEGREWLKVKLANGNSGWISNRIVKEVLR